MSETPTTRLALAVDEVAEALGVSARTVERLIASGELPSKKLGRRRLVAVAALERFLADTDHSEGGHCDNGTNVLK